MSDRLNRGVLTFVGFLLVGVGSYGLARGYGAFGNNQADDPLLLPDVRDFVSRNADWFWPSAAVGFLLLALLALRWLRAQLTPPGLRPSDFIWQTQRGTTSLRPTGATGALARELESYQGVQSASVRIEPDVDAPEMWVRVDVSQGADLAHMLRKIQDHALVRFRQALETENLAANIEFRLKPPVRDLR